MTNETLQSFNNSSPLVSIGMLLVVIFLGCLGLKFIKYLKKILDKYLNNK